MVSFKVPEWFKVWLSQKLTPTFSKAQDSISKINFYSGSWWPFAEGLTLGHNVYFRASLFNGNNGPDYSNPKQMVLMLHEPIHACQSDTTSLPWLLYYILNHSSLERQAYTMAAELLQEYFNEKPYLQNQ